MIRLLFNSFKIFQRYYLTDLPVNKISKNSDQQLYHIFSCIQNNITNKGYSRLVLSNFELKYQTIFQI
jgi:hypothetical protein